jgi:hypothetical protein
MRELSAVLVGAVWGAALLAGGARASDTSGWALAESRGPSAYRVSAEAASQQGLTVSIAYECTAGAGQRLDIVIPAQPFNAQFLGDESVGVAWNWKRAPLASPISFDASTGFEQVKIDRSSGQDDGKVILSFTGSSAKILDGARRLAKAERPVALGLFVLGRKGAVQPSDMLIAIDVPVKGASDALGKAWSLCGLGS